MDPGLTKDFYQKELFDSKDLWKEVKGVGKRDRKMRMGNNI